MKTDFPTKLKGLRTDKKWSQQATADKLKVSRPKIGHWETGRTEPTLNDLINISNVFGCTVDYLIDPSIPKDHLLHRYGMNKKDYYNMINELMVRDTMFSKLESDSDYVGYMNNLEKLLDIFYENDILDREKKITDDQLYTITQFIDNNKEFIKAKLDN